MARLIMDNPILSGFSGRIGNIVIKQTKHGPVVSMLPDHYTYKPNANQVRQNQKFARAAAYASAINKDPWQRKQWENKVKKGESVYTAVMREYMSKPEEDSKEK